MKRIPTSIAAGELRHRIQIVKASGVQDSMGGVNSQDRSQWTVVRTCWASVEAWTGSAGLNADQYLSTSSHWILLRHPRDFTPTAANKVWFKDFTGKDRTFQIDAVLNPNETSRLLVLICTEVNDSSN